MKAGFRYLVIHVLSGVLLLAGALIRVHETGSIAFEYVGLEGLGAWLIFLSFGIKAAFPLLHNWLTDAYPEGTPTGTVFLSAFTTKVAVYGLAVAFPGTDLLIYIGAAMTAFPIFYAVIENDLRRVLGLLHDQPDRFHGDGNRSGNGPVHRTVPWPTPSTTCSSRAFSSWGWGRSFTKPGR